MNFLDEGVELSSCMLLRQEDLEESCVTCTWSNELMFRIHIFILTYK